MELASNPALSSAMLIALFYGISIPFVVLFVRLTVRTESPRAIGAVFAICVVGLWLVFVAIFGLWEGWDLTSTLARVGVQLFSFCVVFGGALLSLRYRLGSSTMVERSGRAIAIGILCALLTPAVWFFLSCGILRDCL